MRVWLPVRLLRYLVRFDCECEFDYEYGFSDTFRFDYEYELSRYEYEYDFLETFRFDCEYALYYEYVAAVAVVNKKVAMRFDPTTILPASS